jgi:hypothetical protein
MLPRELALQGHIKIESSVAAGSECRSKVKDAIPESCASTPRNKTDLDEF